MRLRAVVGGETTLRIDLPEEEAFESLAGRCRPFTMECDHLHFRRVLAALEPYVAGDPASSGVLQTFPTAWARFDPKNKETVAFNSKTGPAGGQLGEFVTATKLTDAWLYCDFAHADTDAPERAASHDLDARFQAAVFLITNIAFMAMTILNFIRDCVDAGFVPIDVPAFAEPVLARSEYTVIIAALATAAPYTPAAILEAALERLQQESANTDV